MQACAHFHAQTLSTSVVLQMSGFCWISLCLEWHLLPFSCPFTFHTLYWFVLLLYWGHRKEFLFDEDDGTKASSSGCCCFPLQHTPSSTECFFLVKWSRSVPTFVWSRGRCRCCGAWSLYNFLGPLYKKEYEIMNINLSVKVNIYL